MPGGGGGVSLILSGSFVCVLCVEALFLWYTAIVIWIWLIDWLIWFNSHVDLIDRLIDWLIWFNSLFCPIDWLIDWLIWFSYHVELIDWLIDWFDCHFDFSSHIVVWLSNFMWPCDVTCLNLIIKNLGFLMRKRKELVLRNDLVCVVYFGEGNEDVGVCSGTGMENDDINLHMWIGAAPPAVLSRLFRQYPWIRRAWSWRSTDCGVCGGEPL